MAMDRWYNAEDGNIWLAFPSTDRNKITLETFLILKKGSDTDDLVSDAARYKVLAIESEAPDFIKTTKLKSSTVSHSAGSSRDIFGVTLLDAPVTGKSEFNMNYKAYHGTSGQKLNTEKDDLYIEF